MKKKSKLLLKPKEVSQALRLLGKLEGDDQQLMTVGQLDYSLWYRIQNLIKRELT
jgi:hypothetical protein